MLRLHDLGRHADALDPGRLQRAHDPLRSQGAQDLQSGVVLRELRHQALQPGELGVLGRI